MLPWKRLTVCLIDDGPHSSFQGRSSSASSFHASLFQAIDGVMSLALCPQVMSQVGQHFRSSEKQITYKGCFSRQSICLVISLHSGMSRAVHPQEFAKETEKACNGWRDVNIQELTDYSTCPRSSLVHFSTRLELHQPHVRSYGGLFPSKVHNCSYVYVILAMSTWL